MKFYNQFLSNLSKNEKEYGTIQLLPQIETDEIGLIYIDDLFQKIFQTIKTDLICLVKSNAILSFEIRDKISFLSSFFLKKNQQFSAIGKRCALKLKLNNMDFNLSHINSYFKAFSSFDLLRNINSLENSIYSNDFIFLSLRNNKLNIDDIPSFHFGMDRYDTWIPGWLNEHIPVVSLGDECASYNIGNYHKNLYLSKLSENFIFAKIRGDKYKIASNLDLKITNRQLVNGTSVIAFF